MARPLRLRRLHRLQFRLLSVVLLAVAALGAADIGSVRDARLNAIDAAEEETANLSQSLADHAQNVFITLDTVLVGIRERVETDGLGEATSRLQRVMRIREQSLPMLHRLMVLGRDGSTTAMAEGTHLPTGHFAEAAFKQHRDLPDRNMLLGWPVRDPIDGTWVLTVSRRLSSVDGTFLGAVVAEVAVDLFERSFARFDVGARGVILPRARRCGTDGTMAR